MAGVEFKDFSIDVKAAINNVSLNWLRETADEITSQAADNCQMNKEDKGHLRVTYRNVVDEGKGMATVGSPLESSYWEEWGTGEYAAHGDGRKGWWVYIRGQASKGGGKSYKTKEEAEEAAAFLRNVKNLDAVVTNGRRPNYTLEKSFEATKNPAIAELERKLKEMGT